MDRIGDQIYQNYKSNESNMIISNMKNKKNILPISSNFNKFKMCSSNSIIIDDDVTCINNISNNNNNNNINNNNNDINFKTTVCCLLETNKLDIGSGLSAPIYQPFYRSFPDLSLSCRASHYAEMFDDVKFDCYRSILPYFSVCSSALSILENNLPKFGPIVANDLGYLLAHVTFVCGLKGLSLPSLTECDIRGYKFLHFDSFSLQKIEKVISTLLTSDAFVGASIDPVHMIDTAANVGATTIAANEASAMFRRVLDAMANVQTVLDDSDKSIIRRERWNVRFLDQHQTVGDHSLMAAYREIIRQDFDFICKLKNTNLRTLILGATAREYSMYNNQQHVFFQIANQEGKDTDRLVLSCLEGLRKTKRSKIHKGYTNIDSQKRACNDVKTIDQMLLEWKNSRKIPNRFLLWDECNKLLDEDVSSPLSLCKKNHPKFDQFVFQDVGYNFEAEDWYQLFRRTGATQAYGYLCLPWELLEPNIVSPPGYKYKVEGEFSHLAYHGFSNGYVHKTSAWRTLMEQPAIVRSEFCIGIEFISRIGPMTTIKLFRMQHNEKLTRSLEVPSYLKTTLILSIHKSMDSCYEGEVDVTKLSYIPVRTDEFEEALNYAIDIAKESLTYRNVLLFIRRKCAGVSLVTKELSKTWTVSKSILPEFSLVVFLYATHLCENFEQIQRKNTQKRFSAFMSCMWHSVKWAKRPLAEIYNYFKRRDIFHLLIKDVKTEWWQDVYAKQSDLKCLRSEATVFTGLDEEDLLNPNADINETDEDINFDTCLFCDELKDCLGEQEVICNRESDEITYHKFGLNSEELTRLKTSLTDTTLDPIGLKTVKEEAAKKLPPANFYNSVKVSYICGPPGTGKSYAIRAMATKDDLIVAPFSRLREDYTNFIHPITGAKTTLRFSTQHTAFSALNHSRIFVDEFTAMPYECLAVIVNNCAAQEVVLVGDHRQTSLINEVEGIPIGTKINLLELRSHELVKNYRNPRDVVDVLNNVYKYRMKATKDFNGFEFRQSGEYHMYPDHTPLFFRHATAERFGVLAAIREKVTVRANQGATYDNVKLIITNDDMDLFNMPSMAIVALSRHRQQCVILHDNTDHVNAFIGNIKSGLGDIDVVDGGSGGNNDNNIPPTGPPGRGNNDDGHDNPPPTGPNTGGNNNNVNGSNNNPTTTNVGCNNNSRHRNNNSPTSRTSGRGNDTPNSKDSNINSNDDPEYIDMPPLEDETKPEEVDGFAVDNTCLLQAICNLTMLPYNNVYNNMRQIIGNQRFLIGLELGLDLDDLDSYCINNKIRIDVSRAGTGEVRFCGLEGAILGCIEYTGDGNSGHFEVEKIYDLASNVSVASFKSDSPVNSVEEDENNTFFDANNNFENIEDELVNEDVDSKIFDDSNASIDTTIGTYNNLDDEITLEDLANLRQRTPDQIFINDRFYSSAEPVNYQENLLSPTNSINLDDRQVAIDNVLKAFGQLNSESFKNRRNLGLRDNITNDPNELRVIRANVDFDLLRVRNSTSQQPDNPPRTSVDRISNFIRKSFTRSRSENYSSRSSRPNNRFSSRFNWRGTGRKAINTNTSIGKSLPQNSIVEPMISPPEAIMNASETFKEMARLFANPISLNVYLRDMQGPEERLIIPIEQTSFDAFKMLVEEFATHREHDLMFTNEESLGYFNKNFDNGKFDCTVLDNLNPRGHPKKTSHKVWSLLNVAPGVTYFGKSLTQSLNCLQARYLTKAYVTIFNNESVQKAHEIADLFYNEHMSENFDIFNEQDIYTTCLESEHAMKTKNYESQCNFNMGGDTDVRFSMKDIFKPFKNKIDLYKAGQGISAWSKDLQTIFQTAFRVLNKHFINCLREHVVYDNGVDEHTLMSRINMLFALLPNTCTNGVIDATACDSGQNRFTQLIERRILERMGVNTFFLDWYYSHREEYILKGYGVTAKVKGIKTSGEPATLLNNTILMACLMNYIIRGEGPAVLVIKGDDGLKRQSNLNYRMDLLPQLRRHLKMEFKVDINVPITFCGYFLSGSTLVPDIVRKCFKILGHRFRDYAHFCEYQESLRDWILNVNRIGISDICHITSSAYNISFEYVYALLNSIISLAHIGEKQFKNLFSLKEINLEPEFLPDEKWSEKLPWYHGYN